MFQSFYGQILTTLNEFMDNKYQGFIDAFRPLALAILTIYLMFSAYSIIFGKTEKAKEVLITMAVSSLLTLIIFSYGIYKEYIMDTILLQSFKLQGYFLTLDGSGLPAQTFNTLENTFSTLFSKLEELEEKMSLWSSTGIQLMICIYGLKAVFGILYLVFSVLVIYSTFAIYVFFVIGGIPLFLAIMPGTRFVFWAWLRAVMNYILIPVFTSIVMAISLKFLGAVVEDFIKLDLEKSGIWNIVVANAFFMGCLSIFFHLKAPEFAAAITGGQPSGIGGFFASAAGVGATAWGLSKFAGSKGWGLTKGVAKSPLQAVSAYNSIKNGVSTVAETAIRAKNAFSKSKGL